MIKKVKFVDILVDYDDSEWTVTHPETLKEARGINAFDYPETKRGKMLVRFCELVGFGERATDHEVLEGVEAMNCRQLSRAEAETFFRESVRGSRNPRLGFANLSVLLYGSFFRPYVIGVSVFGESVRWHWVQGSWARFYGVVVACKENAPS